MSQDIPNSNYAAVAARHRSIYANSTVPVIVRRQAEDFSVRPSLFTPSIDSLWDLTLLDRLKMPLRRRRE
jgi:DNA-binding MarR family transcriptional regulator